MNVPLPRRLNQQGFHVHFVLPILAILAVAAIGTLILGIDHAATPIYTGPCTGATYSTTTANTTSLAKACITQAQDLLDGIQHASKGGYLTATTASVPNTFAYGSQNYLTMNGVYSSTMATAVQRLYGNAQLTGGKTSNTGWQALCQAAVRYGFNANSGAGASLLKFSTTTGQYTGSSLYIIFRNTCGTPPSAPSAAPTGVTNSEAYSELTTNWKAVAGATQYQVYLVPTGGKVDQATTTVTQGVFTLGTAGNGGTIKVRAGNATGWGPWSATASYAFNECLKEGGNPSGSGCYFWGQGTQGNISSASGAQVTMSATNPKVSSTDDHADSEINVMSNNQNYQFEANAIVVTGETSPHLQIDYWKNGSMYTNGFVTVAGAPVHPDGPLPTTGTYTFAMKYANAQWQFWYNGKEVGYYPESVWGSNVFTSIGFVDVYGETQGYLNTLTTSQMGNGQLGTSSSSSYFTNYTLLGTTTKPSLTVAGPSGSAAARYKVGLITPTSFHYGGPGF